jgi:phosphoglycolate phosphatase-like HAD superfamily hydrolase
MQRPHRVVGVIRHIVWDWNGTLLDDNHAVLAAVNAVCASYQRQPITLEEWRAVFCRPLDRCYERLLGRSLSGPDWARIDLAYHQAYRALLPDQRLAPDAADALRAWRAGSGTQSLLSMWFHDDLVRLVAELGLAGEFTRVDGLRAPVGGGSKSDHLADHLAALGLDPPDVVLIGDVEDDAAAAASVGARCILLSTGINSRAGLERTGVPVADSITAALTLVRADRAA